VTFAVFFSSSAHFREQLVLLANMVTTNPPDCLKTLEELVHDSQFKNLPQDKNIPIVLGKYT
jgi:hypothetical protein